jgi:hypothetical protein
LSVGAASWRRLRLGIRTLVGRRPGGFFIPYRHAPAVVPVGYASLEPLFAAALPDMLRRLTEIETLADALRGLTGPPPRPRWAQDWFPRLDGAALYAMVRLGRPRRVLEIGSGHSTRFVVQAIADERLACSITCIDPQPRADLASLPVNLHRRLFAPSDATLAAELAAGDLLLVDSSHVAVAGSDVDLLLNLVLPRLATGVLVHFHDIFLPDPYPAAWAWRGYNEQVALAPLLHGGGYSLLWSSHYLATRCADRLARGLIGELPLGTGAFEGSLWLEKRAAAAVVHCA